MITENIEPNVNTPQDTTEETKNDTPGIGSVNCLPIGTRLADFEITGVIGEGGFGIVYLAFDHSLRRTVAIKEYMPGALAGRNADNSVSVRSKRHQETFETGLKSFINEARLLAQFDHAALVKVYRFWEENNTGYMAMRYYEGQTLKSVVKNDPAFVTEAWLKSMLKPILEALDALYKMQILHRDISPDNIVIQKNGEAVLLDFGAARQIISDMTHALTVILKPGYAPVEQYADDTSDASMKQGPWTDIYALSAVVYSAIVKKPPPTSVTRMIKDPIELLANGNHPGFSREFLAAIDKGLAVKPEDRPQSIDEFRTLLGLKNRASAVSDALPVSKEPVAASAVAVPAGKPVPVKKEQPAAVIPAKPKPEAAAPAKNGQAGVKPKPSSSSSKSSSSSGTSSASSSSKTRSKASNTGALVVVAAAVILAASYGGYRFINRGASPLITENKPAPAPVAVAAPAPEIPPAEAQPPIGIGPQAQAELKTETTLNTDKTPAASASATSPPSASASATAAGPVEAKPVETPAEPEKLTGIVNLSVKPWGTILVDGDTKGVSPPLKKLRLPEGKHEIRVVNPNFPDYVTQIDVHKKKAGSIEYNFSSVSKSNSSR